MREMRNIVRIRYARRHNNINEVAGRAEKFTITYPSRRIWIAGAAMAIGMSYSLDLY